MPTAPETTVVVPVSAQPPPSQLHWFGVTIPNPLPMLEAVLKRDEADLVFVAANVAFVALEIIEWPVAMLAVTVHAIGRSRYRALRAVALVAEEAE